MPVWFILCHINSHVQVWFYNCLDNIWRHCICYLKYYFNIWLVFLIIGCYILLQSVKSASSGVSTATSSQHASNGHKLYPSASSSNPGLPSLLPHTQWPFRYCHYFNNKILMYYSCLFACIVITVQKLGPVTFWKNLKCVLCFQGCCFFKITNTVKTVFWNNILFKYTLRWNILLWWQRSF